MTPQMMTEQVNSELEHIPDWPGEHQSELRMLAIWRVTRMNRVTDSSTGRGQHGASTHAAHTARFQSLLSQCGAAEVSLAPPVYDKTHARQ
jgi:hypothetical protein